jgi:sister chromatid cohesion protein DCC1
MHLVSLSQSHDAASVQELSRSLEYEHEVRSEVTLQVMRWFGQVDVANERWKMDVEKVVRQVGLGILRQHKVWFKPFSALVPIDRKCFSYFSQTDPISEDEFMAEWNTAVGDTFVSHTSLKLLTVSIYFLGHPHPLYT